MDIIESLETCLNGGAVLFCGAGFSADCLNFDGVEIGTGYPLLELLNHELDYSFEDLQTAADEFVATCGHHTLMNLLKDRYQVKRIPQAVQDVLRYPWDRIYTTNYDDSISLALRELSRPYRRINNLDDPALVPSDSAVQVIHLHGSTESWDNSNFEQSCILGAQSYYKHDTTTKWKNHLEHDFNYCRTFIFIGFSARDYYLNRVFFNATASRDKVFFVNSTGSQQDRQLIASQRNFGTSLPIGRDEFAQMTKEASDKVPPLTPRLASFEEVNLYPPKDSAPGIDAVTKHLVFGILDIGYLIRDIDHGTSDYRVKREPTDDLVEHISKPGNIGLVTGSVCTGKSLLALEVMHRVRRDKPVFHLRVAYSDVVQEVRKIVDAYPNCLLCIEECFLLGDQLLEIAEIIDGTQASLLLTSRDVAYDAASDDLIVSASRRSDRVKRFPLSKLSDAEIEGFISLSERIAGWRELSGRSQYWKRRYIRQKCHSNMAEFLLHLLESEVIQKKVEDVYHQCISTVPGLEKPLVVALYLQHIGLPVQLEILSTLLETDVGALLNKPGESPKFEIIRREDAYIRTLPSIGARELLRRIVDDEKIVEAVTEVVRSLSENRRYGQTYTHVFNQFMRYPLLQGVVVEKVEIDRFFDQLSLHPWVKRQSHFWLQFSMAKTDFGEYESAEKYLENAYGIAKGHQSRRSEQGLKQLDDQKAKFLLRSRTRSDNYADYIYVLRDTTQTINRILDMPGLTFHIYDTLLIYCQFIEKRFPNDFHESQHDVVRNTTRHLAIKARSCSERLTEFHGMRKADIANERLMKLLNSLGV